MVASLLQHCSPPLHSQRRTRPTQRVSVDLQAIQGRPQEHPAFPGKKLLVSLLTSRPRSPLFKWELSPSPNSPQSFLLGPQPHLCFPVGILWVQPLRAWHLLLRLLVPSPHPLQRQACAKAAPACAQPTEASSLLRSVPALLSSGFLCEPESAGNSALLSLLLHWPVVATFLNLSGFSERH